MVLLIFLWRPTRCQELPSEWLARPMPFSKDAGPSRVAAIQQRPRPAGQGYLEVQGTYNPEGPCTSMVYAWGISLLWALCMHHANTWTLRVGSLSFYLQQASYNMLTNSTQGPSNWGITTAMEPATSTLCLQVPETRMRVFLQTLLSHYLRCTRTLRTMKSSICVVRILGIPKVPSSFMVDT